MSLSNEQNSILALLNLESEDVEDVSLANVKGNANIHLSLRPDYPPCPDCGTSEVLVKSFELKRINHGALTNQKCALYYKVRRYRCPARSTMKRSALTLPERTVWGGTYAY